MKLLSKILWNINVLIAIALAISYGSTIVNPADFWPLSFFGLFYPVLLIGNILFIIYWLISKPKNSWISILVLVLGWNHLMGFINFNTDTYTTSPHAISVMSYNIQNAGWAYSSDKEKRKKRTASFVEFMSQHKEVDILCTQETGSFGRETIKKSFTKVYEHKENKKGATIFSKYPIINQGKVEFGTNTNSCVWADIAFPADTVRVYSMHLQSNNISKDASEVLDNVNLNEKQTWTGVGGILNKYKNANQKRSTQSKLVKDHILGSKYPVILSGDFNDPPTSYTYNILSEDMQDSFCEKGLGISSTYAGRIPFLRIDYIMASQDDFDIIDYERLKVDYSDHYPIKSKVILKGRN